MMNPPNNKTNSIVKLAAVIDATVVWNTDAKNRNIDNDDKCTAKSRTNCLKNLKY